MRGLTMQRINQGRQIFEVETRATDGGLVRLTATLTPENARALGEALIAEADRLSPPESHAPVTGDGQVIYRVVGDGQGIEKFSVGDRVVYARSTMFPPKVITIGEIKSHRVEGEIKFLFRAYYGPGVHTHAWRDIADYRRATPEDEAGVR